MADSSGHRRNALLRLEAIDVAPEQLSDLANEGYVITKGLPLASELSSQTLAWSVREYRTALAVLPQPLQSALTAAWGEPEGDPAVRKRNKSARNLTSHPVSPGCDRLGDMENDNPDKDHYSQKRCH